MIVACYFESDEAADRGARALLAAGIPDASIRIGAVLGERASAIARNLGIGSGVDPSDPLAGVAGLAAELTSRGAIDRGAALGAAVGLAAGVAIGLSPYAAFVPVAPTQRVVADALLLFALGAVAGGAFGNAFGPRRSTHVGYRIVDGMADGGIGMLVSVPSEGADAVAALLEAAGARDLLRVADAQPIQA